MKALVGFLVTLGSLLLAGCSARGLPDGLKPEDGLRTAWLAYADDGTLLAASREVIVRLDTGLNELDGTRPPFPFDERVNPPGLMYFSAARDGRVVAMSWQADNAEPPGVSAGAVVFEVPSAALIRLDRYDGAEHRFGGMSLSPDGRATATMIQSEVRVTAVPGGEPMWQTDKAWLAPPVFSADGAALVVAPSEQAFEVLRGSDGASLLTIPALGWHWYAPVAISADGSTLASIYGNDGGGRMLGTWRLSDGAPIVSAPFPAGAGGAEVSVALSPRGDMVAASLVPGGDQALLVWRGEQLLHRDDQLVVWALAFSPDGGTLAVASDQRGLQLLRTSDFAVIAERVLPR